MKITADTNILVRILVCDDAQQAAAAKALLSRAERIAIPLAVFCELVWVLRRGYCIPAPDIAHAIWGLLGTASVVAERPAVEAGLALLEAGGDFADGVIAYDGARLGGDTFASFDKQATAALSHLGVSTLHLQG